MSDETKVRGPRRSDEAVAADYAERAEKARLKVLRKQAAPLLDLMMHAEEWRADMAEGTPMADAIDSACKVLSDALKAQFPDLTNQGV